ncbi:hypothetical protein ACOMHN_000791 [Nucella lapillus]
MASLLYDQTSVWPAFCMASLLYRQSSVWPAFCMASLLYGSPVWIIYHHHLRLLNHPHQRCFRTILDIHWSDFVTRVEILEQAERNSMEATLMITH